MLDSRTYKEKFTVHGGSQLVMASILESHKF
jgi:hypothetical protein